MFKGCFRLVQIGLLSLGFVFLNTGWCGPWFTGPLLAPSGHTIPRGHTNFEMYLFDTVNTGFYNRHWKAIPTFHSENIAGVPIFSHGLTDKLDIQFSVPYVYNRVPGATSRGFGDVTAVLGYQLLEQKESAWMPDLRVAFQQILPTGKFKRLNPLRNGADATGLGSYQTGLSLNFQHLKKFSEPHYLRTRLSFSYLHASNVELEGLTAFGGTPETMGVIDPGHLFSADIAAEYSLTQNWVAVMEAYYAQRSSTSFSGFIGTDAAGDPASIGHGDMEEVSLAPAIEYNFSPNVGIIAGPWFTVAGRLTSRYVAYVVALNAYW